MLPLVPFGRLPRKSYQPDREPHVVRVDLEFLRAPPLVSEYDSEEDESWDIQSRSGVKDDERLSNSSSEDDDNSSYSSYSSYSSSSYSPRVGGLPPLTERGQDDDADEYHSTVSSLAPSTTTTIATNATAFKKKKLTFVKSIQRFIRSRRSYALFQLWRQRKAKERRSAMLIRLEEKGGKLKQKLYEEIEKEILEDEKYVLPSPLSVSPPRRSLHSLRAVEKHTKKLLRIQKTLAHRVPLLVFISFSSHDAPPPSLSATCSTAEGSQI
jgi:hypothetical protein